MNITSKASTQLSPQEIAACQEIMASYAGHDTVFEKHYMLEGLFIQLLHEGDSIHGFIAYSRQDISTPMGRNPIPVINIAATYIQPEMSGRGYMRRIFFAVLEEELGLVWPLRQFLIVSALATPRMYAFYRRYFRVWPQPSNFAPHGLVEFGRQRLGLPEDQFLDERLVIAHKDPNIRNQRTATLTLQQWNQIYASGDTRCDNFFTQSIFQKHGDHVSLTTNRLWIVAQHSLLIRIRLSLKKLRTRGR